MTHKSKIFSAFAIAAAGALMITTTAYQSKAASGINGNNYHVDEGAGYAGGEVAAVASLNTTSSGTFHYDAPGTDDDIKIEGKDITDIETAVKALSRQVTGLGDTAKAADMALDSSAATAITNASTANSASLADIKASIDALSGTSTTGVGAGGIYGTVFKTAFGYVNVDNCICLTGESASKIFASLVKSTGETQYVGSGTSRTLTSYRMYHVTTDNVLKYVVWSGAKTSSQLKTVTPIGRFAYAGWTVTSTSTGGSSTSASTVIVNSAGNLITLNDGDVYTFAPIV